MRGVRLKSGPGAQIGTQELSGRDLPKRRAMACRTCLSGKAPVPPPGVRVGVVLVAGESTVSREVDHGDFTLYASSKLRLDKHQPHLP